MAEQEVQIARWDPFGELRGAFSPRATGLFDELLRERAAPAIRTMSPALDVTESDDAYNVSIEIPGVDKDDVTLECKDGVLSIRGEKKFERDETQDKARIIERSYGAFSRSLSLPADADQDRVHAKFKDGVLRIEIGKRAEAKPRQIAIKG